MVLSRVDRRVRRTPRREYCGVLRDPIRLSVACHRQRALDGCRSAPLSTAPVLSQWEGGLLSGADHTFPLPPSSAPPFDGFGISNFRSLSDKLRAPIHNAHSLRYSRRFLQPQRPQPNATNADTSRPGL